VKKVESFCIENEKNLLKKIINYYLYLKKINKFTLTEKIYGDDNLLLAIPFRKKIMLLEDGLKNYEKQYSKTILTKLKLFFVGEIRSYKAFGYSESIKKIYLTGLAPIPKEIAHKVELINLKELWNKKTLEEQNEILDIFSFDLDIKEKIKERDIILFTQPLSEDKALTEAEKIDIYFKIIKKYPKDRLVIKTHPREKTDYKDIFKEYLVLDNPFPFEILNLLDVKFNKAITLFSTAALGLGKEVKVDFYGTEVHPKILERFGSCNNIMERNCFLKEE
ncbi:MAG: glycosyltransferase family 52, partial [Cetobacterium sp.]|uniref:glycosyltransferase family 52 n=1 Tax=Cetobacterium sp. TaxID=2071632 RepID=UPI003EE4B687